MRIREQLLARDQAFIDNDNAYNLDNKLRLNNNVDTENAISNSGGESNMSGFAAGTFRDTGYGSVLGAGMKGMAMHVKGGALFPNNQFINELPPKLAVMPDEDVSRVVGGAILGGEPNDVARQRRNARNKELGIDLSMMDEPLKLKEKGEVKNSNVKPDTVARSIGGKKHKPLKGGKLIESDQMKGSFMSGGLKKKGRPSKMSGGFKVGDLFTSDFWNNIRIESGSGKSGGMKCCDVCKKAKCECMGRGKSGGMKSGCGKCSMCNKKKCICKSGCGSSGGKKKKEKMHMMPDGSMKGRGARAEIVKKVMKEQGLKMIDASKFVKANNLY